MFPQIYGPVGNNLIESGTNSLNARVGAMLSRSLAFHLPRILTASIPPKLTQYMMKAWAPESAKSLLYDVLHALTHSLTQSISHHLAQVVAQGVTHSITHALVHYYYCIYCYKSGDFCRHADLRLRQCIWMTRTQRTPRQVLPLLQRLATPFEARGYERSFRKR